VADVAPERQRRSIPTFESWGAWTNCLDCGDRLVVIATPTTRTLRSRGSALRQPRRGRHKPFTTTLEEAGSLVQFAKDANRLLNRLSDRRLRRRFSGPSKACRRRNLGRVVRFETSYDRFRPQAQPGACARPRARQRNLIDIRAAPDRSRLTFFLFWHLRKL